MAQERLYQLDSLRGMAALMVVVFHYFYHYNVKYGHSFAVPDWLHLGKSGVYLFFMISGFVIFWTISRADKPMDFLFSRFSRLYPAFWAALIVTFAFTSMVGPADRAVSWATFVVNITMFHEFLGYRHVDGVYWTLSIELTFYILAFGAMVFGLLRFVDYICLAWLAVSFGHAVSGVDFGIVKSALLLKYNLLFVAGISFYRIWSRQAVWLPMLCLVLVVTLAYIRFPLDVAATITVWVSLFGLVISGRLTWLNQPILIWLGSISYSLYLIHQNIGYGIIEWSYSVGVSPVVSIGVSLVFSFCAAHVITLRVEKPALQAMRSWYSARKARASADATAAVEYS
ncbi:acyltransferase [Marinobacter salinexigens]|uniref:Acyltransferase n=1 Tax=Marinobacter salinexigens TaxID=2919747 RepID=A0A5B0VKD3_9GAMM|nr:acyltransferase [Marinobacter salinexigens]KAA1175026.1 acyltransferase [Marinobacter salinexigens]